MPSFPGVAEMSIDVTASPQNEAPRNFYSLLSDVTMLNFEEKCRLQRSHPKFRTQYDRPDSDKARFCGNNRKPNA